MTHVWHKISQLDVMGITKMEWGCEEARLVVVWSRLDVGQSPSAIPCFHQRLKTSISTFCSKLKTHLYLTKNNNKKNYKIIFQFFWIMILYIVFLWPSISLHR